MGGGGNCKANLGRRWLSKHPGLAAFRVVMSVTTEEGSVATRLHPPHHELRVGVAKEPPNISSSEGKSSKADGEKHRSSNLEVGPLQQHCNGGVISHGCGRENEEYLSTSAMRQLRETGETRGVG